jgi:hypothetical protein
VLVQQCHSVKYHLWIDGKGEGPYDKSQIVEMLSTGKITKQTRCLPWDGREGCHVVGKIPDLFDEVNPARPGQSLINRKVAGLLFTVAIILSLVLVAVNRWSASHRRTPASESELKRMEAQVDWYRDSAKLHAEAADVVRLAQVAVSYFPLATHKEQTNVIWATANATNMDLQTDIAARFRQLDQVRTILNKFIVEKEAIRASSLLK